MLSTETRRRGIGRLVLAAVLGCALLTGCAAVSNPVADGIPVRKLPLEYLAIPKDEETPLPLTALRQKPPDVYRLGPGDVLGVYIEGVLGDRTVPPPVRLGEGISNQTPALGYPLPVREDGTVPLPLVKPVNVRGMTLEEAQEAARKAYVVDKEVLQPGRERIILTLMQPRQTRVLVVREDFGGLQFGTGGVLTTTRRGTGAPVDLPAYENDVLNALTRTGGLPGGEGATEIVIQRGGASSGRPPLSMPACHPDGTQAEPVALGGEVLRIPLRLKPGQPIPFTPEEIILKQGDVVYVPARDAEVFYTGGLLLPRQLPLPRDFDLDVVAAVALGGGPLVNGIFGQNNLSGQITSSGLGSPSASLVTVLRRTAHRGQIAIRVDLNKALRDRRENLILQAGDVVILQETPGEAITRYITQQLQFNFLGTIIRERDLTGTATLNVP
jgi:protein involved in polysaccharide export with SLBB domain